MLAFSARRIRVNILPTRVTTFIVQSRSVSSLCLGDHIAPLPPSAPAFSSHTHTPTYTHVYTHSILGKDCYELDNDCLSTEFCWIDQHEKWGSWAMGYQGNSLDVDNCAADKLEVGA